MASENLTALAVDRMKKPGYLGDGKGLWLHVSPKGAKSWSFRFTPPNAALGSNGRARVREMGLGPYPEVTLAAARDKAIELRRAIREGRDPLGEKKTQAVEAARHINFAQAVEQFLKMKTAEFSNPKHIAQWQSTLETYAVRPKGCVGLGNLNVAEITGNDVLRILQPIWTTKTETASRVRGRVEKVLSWATTAKYRSGDNPARWKDNLENLLPKPMKVKKVKHHAALPYAQIGAFMADLKKRDGSAARALEFGVLTAARSGELRGATFKEINYKTKLWTIPAERMKADKEHTVPLSDWAIELLKALPQGGPDDTVFPAPRGGELSDMSMTAVLKRMDYDVTQHGFRSSFRDWAGETTAHPREVIEHGLTHRLKDKAEAAYARGTLLNKRSLLMADWAKFCAVVAEPDADNVVDFKQGVAQ